MSTPRPPTRTALCAWLFTALGLGAATLTGCPDLPDKTGDASDTSDTEVFVPLSLGRVYEAAGEPAGGERVAIFGAGFLGGGTDVNLGIGTEVRFGGTKADAVLVLDDGQINVTVPARPAGLVDVTVTLPDGQEATLEDAYLYRGPLAIASITPSRASIDGGVEVTVEGAGFTENTRILVGGRMLEGARRVDDTTIRGVVPARLAADAGVVDVIASNGFEQRVLGAAFTYVRPLTLAGLDPVSGPSTGGTLVTLRGTGLSLATVVRFAGVPAENVSVDPRGELLVTRAPPGPHGAADVVAENSDGSATDVVATATLPKAFFRVDPASLPGVLWAGHLFPATGALEGGEVVAISVRGLTSRSGVSVRFGQVEAVILEIRLEEGAVVVEAPPAAAGPVEVVVSRAGVSTTPLTYTYAPAVGLELVSPASGPLSGLNVALVGRGLARDGVVKVGGRVAQIRSGGGTNLQIVAPPSVPGAVDVTYTYQGKEIRLPAGFEYRSAEAKLWAVSPGLGAQSGGRIVRFFGEGFQTAFPNPIFGTTAGTDLVRVDDHEVIARAPRGDEGWVNVGKGAVGRIAMSFRYFDPRQRFGGTSGGPIPEALNVTVQDYVTRKGVPNAFVMLWDDLDGPYQGLTDDRGQLTFSDVYFGPMQMVTAGADNYTTESIVEFDARDVTLTLIPLLPSDGGGGGGGGGSQPLPDSTLAGKVVGFDKYVLTPPGDCDARLASGQTTGALCAPCANDAECGGGGNRCTPIDGQGARCTSACAQTSDCPTGYACMGVSGGAQCVPSSGQRTAMCRTTVADVFAAVDSPFAETVDQQYRFSTRPGEYAVVCLGGVKDDVSGVFTPLVMGVRRHVFAQSDSVVDGQDVTLDIPLTRKLRIRLDGAPVGRFETERHTAQVFVDFGADGVFLMPQEGTGIDTNLFELGGFPAAFAESLYDASLTVYATAVADVSDAEQTGIGSFVLQDQIREIFSDAVFELEKSVLGGVETPAHRKTGISQPIYAMAGLAGTNRLWAAGDAGRVAAFDGEVWGLQQAPTSAPLFGIWARAEDDVWAAGDAGAVVHFDGLRWLSVPMPAEVARAAWWGITGSGDGSLWLWGERGTWRKPAGGEWAVVPELGPGGVNAIATVSPEEAWIVGAGGLIRRWQGGVVTTLDKPGLPLRAVTVVSPNLAWAVGDSGRILRWDGNVWFELLPVTSRGLRGVTASAPEVAWAVGDAGEVLRWDGIRWRREASTPGSDLMAVGETASGRAFAAGVATLVIGPFMQLPRASNPSSDGNLSSLELRWLLDPGADASLTWISLLHPSGFPFWQIFAKGERTRVPLPDLEAAWGLQALWPGQNAIQIVRIYVPDFDMGSWDESLITPYRWRSWAFDVFPLNIPEPASGE